MTQVELAVEERLRSMLATDAKLALTVKGGQIAQAFVKQGGTAS